MNIYKVSRKDEWDYDEFDSLVCYAESEEKAMEILPYGEHTRYTSYWNKENLDVELIGENKLIIQESIIVSSFNAG